MSVVRRLLLRHRLAATLLVLLALAMRAVLPSGTMLDTAGGGVTVALCSGSGPMRMTMPMRDAGDGQRDDGHHAAAPCAFAGLAIPALPAVDAILLAGAIAFIVASALRVPTRLPARTRTYLRPPLRGPPAG